MQTGSGMSGSGNPTNMTLWSSTIQYQGFLYSNMTTLLANCTQGDCPQACTDTITLTGASDWVYEEEEEEDMGSGSSSGYRLLAAKGDTRMLQSGGASIAYASNGADSISIGEASGATVHVNYNDDDAAGLLHIGALFIILAAFVSFIW